jgi:hypothetical protein
MTTTELIEPPRASRPPEPSSVTGAGARPVESLGEMLEETLPIVGVTPVHGPAALLVAGPWVLLALILSGPVAVIVTLLALLVAAVAFIGLVAALLAAPFVLVRRLRSVRADHKSVRAERAVLVSGESRWGTT